MVVGALTFVTLAAGGLAPADAFASKTPVVRPIYRVRVHEREVALTLDDGPDPRYTPQVLAALRKYHAHATFFVMGVAANADPGLVRQELAGGNEVGVHAFDKHVRFPGIPKAAAGRQIDLGRTSIATVTGDQPAVFRPPYGAWRPWVIVEAKERGMRTILWSVCFDHRSAKTSKAISDRVLSLVRPGEILLLHDGRGDRRRAIAALPMVLRELDLRGFKVVTVSHLLADSAAGK